MPDEFKTFLLLVIFTCYQYTGCNFYVGIFHYKIVIDTLNYQESYGTQNFVSHIFGGKR